MCIRDLIRAVMSNIGCTGYNGFCLNLLAYADDIVILAPSWQGLQLLLTFIDKAARGIEISFSIQRRLCVRYLIPAINTKWFVTDFHNFNLLVAIYHLYHSSVILVTLLRIPSVMIATSIER